MRKHDAPRVRPVDTKGLPPELTKQLSTVRTKPGNYTIEELAMSFINQYGKATCDDLMTYVYQIRNKVTSRGYMLQVVHRLRRDGLVLSEEAKAPCNVRYQITGDGKKKALEFLEPEE